MRAGRAWFARISGIKHGEIVLQQARPASDSRGNTDWPERRLYLIQREGDMKAAQYYKPARQVGFALVALGMLLHVYIAFVEASGGVSAFSLGLMLWSWLPYLLALILFLWLRNPIAPLCGVLGPFALDMLVYYDVFIHPRSSTAALALLFAPLWSLIIFEPIGLLIGWIVAKRWTPNSCGAGEAPP